MKDKKAAVVAVVLVLALMIGASSAHAGCSGLNPSFHTGVECSPFQTIQCEDQWVTTGAGGAGGYYCVCQCVIMGGNDPDAVTCNTVGNREYWDCIARAEQDGQEYTPEEAQLCRILAYLANDSCYLAHA